MTQLGTFSEAQLMALRNRYQHHDRQKHNPLMAMVVHLPATDHGAVEHVECGKMRIQPWLAARVMYRRAPFLAWMQGST
ncbi:hypothetical protein [Mesorhizobium sp. M0244]|uniref:hypothetical protein n=1 Tax=Mesorhizobium sp. M0244 TaxID=2956926 RepID=UPI0033352BC8